MLFRSGGGSGSGGSTGGGDSSGGDFWVYGDSTVTRVNLKRFKAHETREGVLLEWQTGYEVNNLGFHLYREVNGEVLRLTPELVAGSAFLAGSGTSLRAGHQYRWWDTSVISHQSPVISSKRSAGGGLRSAVRYWLEDVDLNGKRTMHGPVEVQLSASSFELSAPDFRRAELMSEFGKKLDKRYEEFWRAQELREKLKKNVNRYTPPPSPSPLPVESLRVEREGEGRGGGASVLSPQHLSVLGQRSTVDGRRSVVPAPTSSSPV